VENLVVALGFDLLRAAGKRPSSCAAVETV
jgi:hypothetical protein